MPEPDLAALHRGHARALAAYAARILGTHDAWVDDMVQDAFLRAHASCIVDRLGPSRAVAWLYVVVRNGCFDALRQRRRTADLDDELAGAHDVGEAVARRVHLAELFSRVHALNARQRHALALSIMCGRSYREIAVDMGTSEIAVKSLLYRARSELQRHAA